MNNKKKLFKILAAVVGIAMLVSIISFSVSIISFSAFNSNTKQETSTNTVTSVSENSDRMAPVITLAADTISVELGTDYKISDNIKSVKDNIDGEIKKVEKLSKNASGYIIDDSKINLKKVGEYQVTVEAQDKSGNVAKKTFKLAVKEKSDKPASEKKETASVQKSETKTESKKADSKTSTSSSKKSTDTSTKKTQPSKSSGSASNNSGSSSSSKPSTSQQSTQKSDTSGQTNSNSGSASSSNSSASVPSAPQTQPQHVHSWEWVPEKTHTETVVVQEGYDIIVCNGCGRQFRDPAEFSAHYDPDVDVTCGAYHIDTVQPVTEQRVIVDCAGYYRCSTCGATK